MMLSDKTILITGGTGSFGQAFIEKILKEHANIKKIIVYSRDEYKQFLMSQTDLIKKNIDKIRFFIGDVRDKDRLELGCREVDIIVHAAALKQVVAAEYNPFEFIKTNILGAENVISAAIKNNVEKVIALSTDKACAPVNLYGATKLCSDRLFIAASSYVGPGRTKFAVVRYGNVAGSRGSVIPFFYDLISKGAEFLPITHPDMTRFWLTLDDSVDMVLDCMELSAGGELFIKKIPSIKITDLARIMAPNLEQKIVGIRPGEKINETLMTVEDSYSAVETDKYYIVLPFEKTDKHFAQHGNTKAKNSDYSSEKNDFLNDNIVTAFLQENGFLSKN